MRLLFFLSLTAHYFQITYAADAPFSNTTITSSPSPALSSAQTPAYNGSSSICVTLDVLQQCGPASNYRSQNPADASACSTSWSMWSVTSNQFIWAHLSTSTSIGTATLNKTLVTGPTSYAICNGFPRGVWFNQVSNATNNTKPAQTITNHVVSTYTTTITSTLAEFSAPTPSCEIAPIQCESLLAQYHNRTGSPEDQDAEAGPDLPHCDTTWPGGGDCAGCVLMALNSKFYYWPDREVVNWTEICPPETYSLVPSSVKPLPMNPLTPVTAIMTLTNEILSLTPTIFTFTSPTAYLSIEELQGRRYCGDQWGIMAGESNFRMTPKGTC